MSTTTTSAHRLDAKSYWSILFGAISDYSVMISPAEGQQTSCEEKRREKRLSRATTHPHLLDIPGVDIGLACSN
jgi:hypothetical protein